MYENRHGRFMAVDPLLASGKSANPQTFNRYVYVLNNPASLTDPSGLCTEGKNCPRNYYGTVYTKTINGVAHYNDERPDDSWSVFTGEVAFVRKDTKVRTVFNQYGWSEQPEVEVSPEIRALIGGFNRTLAGAQSGAAKGFGNVVIDAANAVILAYSAQNPISLLSARQIQRYQYNSVTEAKYGTAIEVTALLAPTPFKAAGFSKASSLSVVPQNLSTKRNLLQDLFAMQRLKGNTEITSGTAFEATKLGRAWVNGANVKRMTIKDGIGWTDGIRSFRLQFKPADGVWKANFQENTRIFNSINNNWQTFEVKNVHMVINNMKPLQ